MRGETVPRSLVIVESPAKAKTISKFLGRNYQVKASMGHVKDLPRSQFGVDIENGFTPKYITIRGKGPILQQLRDAAKKAGKVYLATDPDREGEAISWHLAEALKLDPTEPCRVEFNEITQRTVKEAIKHPRPINKDLVDAQQARRILDRLVGYQLSPLLWSKVKPGLSAGRVQSVAVRLICDREREIQAFKQEEYWTVSARLQVEDGDSSFIAQVNSENGKKLEKIDEAHARAIVSGLEAAKFTVASVVPKQRRRNPAAPFTTSTLQQEASRRLGFSAAKTMRIAQQLYEGLDVGGEGTVGLITYIRTDAVRVAQEAQDEAREYIEQVFGKEYRPQRPPQYKTKEGAQAAHEAIRPTSVHRTPEKLKDYLQRDQLRLYRLIWQRFVASQMSPAVMDTLTVDIAADVDPPNGRPRLDEPLKTDGEDGSAEPLNLRKTRYVLRATGSKIRFLGFMKLYIEKQDDEKDDAGEKFLPELKEGQSLRLQEAIPEQHFTQPPLRFSEAMLVKTLEELGIGRPSTYAPIIDTIQRRGYVRLVDKRFEPTELGFIVTDLLKEHFAQILDTDFTANLESQLDSVEEGKVSWTQVLSSFYEVFSRDLEQAAREMESVELEEEVSDEVCEKCGRNMVVKHGRFGKFLACPGFPECRNTKPLLQEIGVKCPKCGGQIVERRSRKGRLFYGCSNYPDCDFVSWYEPLSRQCPECGAMLVRKKKRNQPDTIMCTTQGCSYRESEARAGEQ